MFTNNDYVDHPRPSTILPSRIDGVGFSRYVRCLDDTMPFQPSKQSAVGVLRAEPDFIGICILLIKSTLTEVQVTVPLVCVPRTARVPLMCLPTTGLDVTIRIWA